MGSGQCSGPLMLGRPCRAHTNPGVPMDPIRSDARLPKDAPFVGRSLPLTKVSTASQRMIHLYLCTRVRARLRLLQYVLPLTPRVRGPLSGSVAEENPTLKLSAPTISVLCAGSVDMASTATVHDYRFYTFRGSCRK